MKSIIKPVIIRAFRFQAELRLTKISSIKYSSAGKIANAVNGALKNNLDTEENGWINKIEKKREELKNTTKEISITDFGAGNPNLDRTKTEMYDGVNTTATIGETCKLASKPYFWSLLLFKLIREFKPSICLELGTSLGISGAYQAAAQKLNNRGRLITLEGSESLASLAEKNFQQLGLCNAQVVHGRFQDNLDRVLTENKNVNYAFIDEHHDEKATISYFEKVIPYLSKNSIIVFDDISWSDGMRRAWKYIEQNKLIKNSLNLGVIGVCVLDENIDEKFNFRIPIL